MILNVVLASVKQALPMIPSVVFLVVETLLLIVRAVMAVLFGHAIHALREEYAESTITVKEAHELQQGLQELANVVSRFHQQLAHVESNVQQRLNESATVLASSLQVELAQVQTHVQTTLQAHQDQLATLPQLQAQLQQMESTSREQFHHMQAILEERAVRSVSESEKLNERPSLHVVPVAQQGSRTTKPEERRRSPERALSEEKFDARVFVFACLEENREWKLADIEQLALAAGHTLSQPSISRYRKQFYARRESTTIQSASSFANAENTSESAMMKELALGE